MSRFFVVSGLPGSGKSTLGTALANRLHLPLLDKDEILEALFDALGAGDTDWRTRLSRGADVVLRRLANGCHGAVLVSWWKHPRLEAESGTNIEWLASLPGEVVEVHCQCSPQVAVARYFARQRHVGHLDNTKSLERELERFAAFSALGPLGVGRLAVVGTEQPVDVEALLLLLAGEGADSGPAADR